MGDPSELALTVRQSFEPSMTIEITLPLDELETAHLVQHSGVIGPGRETLHTTLEMRHRLRLVRLLDGMSLSYTSSGALGLDGTAYHLFVRHRENSMTLQWWQVVPVEWTGVSDLVDEVLLLRGSLLSGLR